MPRLAALALWFGFGAVTLVAFAEETSANVEVDFTKSVAPFFAPFTTDRAALAPDGKHVAYTLHKGESVYVIIMAIDRPEEKVTLAVGDDRRRGKTRAGSIVSDVDQLNASRPNFGADEKTPATVPLLVWPGPNRLVMSNDVPELVAADRDGKRAGKLVDTEDAGTMAPSSSAHATLRRAPKFLEVLPADPDHLLIAAEGEVRPSSDALAELRATVYRVNVHTGKLKTVHDQIVLAGSKIMYDKDGRPRLSFPTKKRIQNYTYRGSSGRGGDFKKFVGDELAPTVHRSPENYLGERSFPFAFDYDPEVAYLASNRGRDTLALYALDLRTKKRVALAPDLRFDAANLDSATAAQQLVFDRYRKKLAGVRLMGITPFTHWLDTELVAVQRDLDRTFSSRFAQILEWDESRSRFLVHVSSCSDPGRFFIYFRAEKRALEFARCMPDLDLETLSATKPFEFDAPSGVHLSGYLTQPADPRISPPPLIVYCHDPLFDRALPSYQRDVQALAAMGFVVAQVNYRGSAGFGRAHREAFTAGLPQGVDRPPVDDILATIDWIASRQPIDQNRVALVGVGYGGTLALRALQMAPARFRCAVTINAPTDLSSWTNHADLKQMASDPSLLYGPTPDRPGTTFLDFSRSLTQIPAEPPTVDFLSEVRSHFFGGSGPHLDQLSPLRHADLIAKPVFVIQDRDHPDLPTAQGPALANAIKRRGGASEYLEVGAEFTERLPRVSAQVFGKVQEFMNLNVYDHGVQVGKPEVK